MKSTLLQLRNMDTNAASFQILTYDETFPCLLCGLPVQTASTGGTAICGSCDMGKIRQGAKKTKWATGKHSDFPGVWANAKEHWEFPTRDEAEAKMYELHLDGVAGWPHVIRRILAALDAKE